MHDIAISEDLKYRRVLAFFNFDAMPNIGANIFSRTRVYTK